ncbi:MAG: hypothetical protein KIT14_18600 [bacterium]|nr:hypothetical protein [bacterium]
MTARPSARMTAGAWAALGVPLLAGLVWWTCAPVWQHPQLDPDDYRYLAIAAAPDASLGSGWVVENRWDHLWWVDAAPVRFFRPAVITSFRLDHALWSAGSGGFQATNVLLHALCALLVVAVLRRWWGSAPAAWLGGLVWASLACHAETIWYLSGRTETLAAAGFLGALAAQAQPRPAVRVLAPIGYALALLSKELTLALPLVALAADRCILGRGPTLGALVRADRGLYAGYAAVLVGWATLRRWALGPEGTGMLPFPYFVAPDAPGFAAHVTTQLRSYAANLVAGDLTPPFLQPAQLDAWLSPAGRWLAPVLAAALLASQVVRPAGRVLVGLGLATWLPTAPVYVSERYLELPSFAVVAALAGMVAGLARRRGAAGALVALLVAWALLQAGELARKNRVMAEVPRAPAAVAARLADLGPALRDGRPLLFVDFPGDWVHAQFLEDQLRVDWRQPAVRARVLAPMGPPWREPAPAVTPEGAARLRVRAAGALVDRREQLFPTVPLVDGTRIAGPHLGLDVTIVDGDGARARAIVADLPTPVADWHVVRFVPPAGAEPDTTPGYVILGGRFELLR